MNEDDFARQFEDLYRLIYARAVRRIRDKRARLSPETVALLTHLSFAGPMTLTEIARHTARAQSTASEMINHLEKKGLLERDQDPDDGRRTLVWLSTEGRDVLSLSRAVLDTKRITTAAARMSATERAELAALFEKLTTSLTKKGD